MKYREPRDCELEWCDGLDDYVIIVDGKILIDAYPQVVQTMYEDRHEYLVEKEDGGRELFVVPFKQNTYDYERKVLDRLSKFNTSLFRDTRVRECRFDFKEFPFTLALSPIIFVDIESGALLSEYLAGKSPNGERIIEAIELLKETLENFDIMFELLSPEKIILGLDGRLYPFQYDEIRLTRPEGCNDCDELRRIVVERCGLDEDDLWYIEALQSYPTREMPADEYLYKEYPSNNRSLVEATSGLWGYVDGDNRVIVEPFYESANSFENGYAVVMSQIGWGLIDINGEECIPTIFDDIEYNGNDICAIRDSEKWAYFTRYGRRLTQFADNYPDLTLSREQIARLDYALPYSLPVKL